MEKTTEQWVAEQLAKAPPLTEEQLAIISRAMRRSEQAHEEKDSTE